jgi:hypothetical protein
MGQRKLQGRTLAMAAACMAAALAWAPPAAADGCSDLAAMALPQGTITRAELVAPGAFQSPAPPMGPPGAQRGNPFASMPGFCRVAATLTPTPDSDIKIELWMPAENWNGKFIGVGNGVWAGQISYFAMIEPVSRSYAVASTDTGHVGSGMDANFAAGHRERLIDFGYRAVHEMTVNAKEILAAYYGARARLAIWTSCSTGGRQGLMSAYRYPEDYDVISAMAPANPMTDLMVQTLWTGYAPLRTPESRLSPQKLAAVHQAYVRACDLGDGLEDQIVSDPVSCAFDPASAQCEGGDAPDCLTPAQVETMRAIYMGPPDEAARARGLGGFPPGSELQLAALVMAPEPFPVATSYMRVIVFEDLNWDFRSFDYAADSVRARAAGSDILDAPPDGLAPFFARGGKLLLSHGWADGLIPAGFTLAFHERLLQAEGTNRDAVRLFMAPGMAHCGGGLAPSNVDLISVAERWAETGAAPERIIASGAPSSPEAPQQTRPWCAFPLVPRYDGAGDPNDEASFACVRAAP